MTEIKNNPVLQSECMAAIVFEMMEGLMTKIIWRLRLWLVYHLVGNKSFAANVDVIGSMIFPRPVDGVSIVRHVGYYKNKTMQKKWSQNK